MKTYNFSVYKDRIKPLSPTKGVSGNTNFYECTFEFSEDWDSLAAVAVFVGESSFVSAIIDSKCTVPHEVLEESGEIYIGVYGTNGKDNLLRISTNLIPFEVEEGAFREGNLPVAPSPDVWGTYIAAMNQTLIDTRDARDEAKGHSDDAKTYKNDAENAKNAAEESAVQAEDYKIQAEDSADLSASHKDEAWRAVQMADGAAGSASGYALDSQRFRNEAEEFKNQAQSYVEGAGTNAEKAEKAEENARKSEFESRRYAEQAMADAEGIRNESENIVHKTGIESIPGLKMFLAGLMASEINGYNAVLPIYAGKILMKAENGIDLESPEGNPLTFKVGEKYFSFYDNGEFEANRLFTKRLIIDEEEIDFSEFIKSGKDKILLNAIIKMAFKVLDGELSFETGYGNKILLDDFGIHLTDEDMELVISSEGVKVKGKPVATEEYVNSKNEFDSISTDVVTSKSGKLEINGATIIFNAPGNINFETLNNGINVDSKKVATEEYVNEAIKDVDGGSITIDNVPTEGSANAVSSGGVYVVIKTQEQEVRRIASSLNDVQADISSLIQNKAEKSYVDSSIQQAILDSWAEVIEP